MLEANPLQRVVQLDVDAKVVRIQLQAVPATQSAALIDIQRQGGDRPVNAKLPVAISGWIRSIVDGGFRVRHGRLVHEVLGRDAVRRSDLNEHSITSSYARPGPPTALKTTRSAFWRPATR